MAEWWEDPRLDDEGTYDYMLGYDYNHVPENTERWVWSWEKHRCTDCGRYAHLYREWEAFFRTYDGYDSIWGSESAYSIIVLGTIHKIKYGFSKLRKEIKSCIDTIKIVHKYKNNIGSIELLKTYGKIIKESIKEEF